MTAVSDTADCSLDLSLGPQNGGEPGSLCETQVNTTLEFASANINPIYLLIVRTAVKQGNASRVQEALDQEGVNPNMKVDNTRHIIIFYPLPPAVVH